MWGGTNQPDCYVLLRPQASWQGQAFRYFQKPWRVGAHLISGGRMFQNMGGVGGMAERLSYWTPPVKIL